MVLYLRTQYPGEADEHPLTLSLWSMVTFTLLYSSHNAKCDCVKNIYDSVLGQKYWMDRPSEKKYEARSVPRRILFFSVSVVFGSCRLFLPCGAARALCADVARIDPKRRFLPPPQPPPRHPSTLRRIPHTLMDPFAFGQPACLTIISPSERFK